MKVPEHPLDDAHAAKCELAGEALRRSGTLRLKVMGWSMLPSVWPGDTLVVDSIKSDAVSVGDIVLYGRNRRLFAHRVVKTKINVSGDSTILTRGDAMPAADPPVAENQLLGRVTFIVRNGKCIEPRRSLRLPERAVAALVRSSGIVHRVAVGVHGMRHA